MIEEVKETIITRIGELAQEASPATLKILAATLEITDKVGREDSNEKYLSSMLELFKNMQKQSESLFKNTAPESLSLTDISKMIHGEHSTPTVSVEG